MYRVNVEDSLCHTRDIGGGRADRRVRTLSPANCRPLERNKRLVTTIEAVKPSQAPLTPGEHLSVRLSMLASTSHGIGGQAPPVLSRVFRNGGHTAEQTTMIFCC